jgi:DMSO/TMAO reductase YedYZ molybdopterin-dependent catalytic subunit
MIGTESVRNKVKEELNRETPLRQLALDITDNYSFYKRNHFPNPEIDPAKWRLRIESDSTEFSFSLEELNSYEQREVGATLECAGNSRSGFGIKVEGEIEWGPGAIGMAAWSGVSFSTIVRNSGLDRRDLAGVTEIIFVGSDGDSEGPIEGKKRFTRSLPIEKALDTNTIIALRMNGKVLPKDHGFPARLIVPGWYAMASVKWLDKIIIKKSKEEFRGHFNLTKYVYVTEGKDSPLIVPVTKLRVKSLITNLTPGQKIMLDAPITIEGKAWSGEGKISTVEVDLGEGWLPATLREVPQKRGCVWSQWSIVWTPKEKGLALVRVRATDVRGNLQPEAPMPNKYLYGYNAIQKLELRVT